ncbi:hypothetical protein EKO04_005086 [Ascochyta lentis]|uniref:Uncharacterized protein n=1 Tax=Ascochyta lentis TaxID=205686 RepID=A0A8H7J7C7_9PLEO|nr:hypothetical protein EKO04_005086 [Ascochyta lentis]
MASRSTLNRTNTTPELTAEDVEAERSYQEARTKQSRTCPPTNQTLDFLFHPGNPSSPPATPPCTPTTTSPTRHPTPQPAPAADSDNPRDPPSKGSNVTFPESCMQCSTPYAADQVWRLLNRAMVQTPVAFAWSEANREQRWQAYLHVLTKQKWTGRRMEGLCAVCILKCVYRAQRWVG